MIVGLGNPGGQYARTRHNIGFICLNRLAHRCGVRFHGSTKDRADIAPAVLSGIPVLLAQPQTYMNESGVAVARMAKRFNLPPARILLVYDDVDLPFATIRIREDGSGGGQRGAKSVIDQLRTSEIPRVRVGIGRSGAPTRDHVLADFTPDESRLLPHICDRVADIAEVVVTNGVVVAMNEFNGKPANPVAP